MSSLALNRRKSPRLLCKVVVGLLELGIKARVALKVMLARRAFRKRL